MFNENLIRRNIRALLPYRCARDDYSDGTLLDANENSLGPCVQSGYKKLERYPCPRQIPIKQRLAALRGVDADNVFLGVGSDECIDLLMRVVCEPEKDKILTCPPTYGMYDVCAQVNDVEVVKVPLFSDFQLNVDEVFTSNPGL